MFDTSQTIGPNILRGALLQEERLKQRENKNEWKYVCTVETRVVRTCRYQCNRRSTLNYIQDILKHESVEKDISFAR
jgi:hypothetical protein